MRALIRSKVFATAFFVSYFFYFYLTIFVLNIQRPGIGVGHAEYGFPFTYYYSTCFGGYYVWFGLVGNTIFAGMISAAIAMACSHYLAKFSSPEFRAKWYL